MTVELRCSYKILPLPLNELSELFLQEPKIAFPYKILNLSKLQKDLIILTKDDFNTYKDFLDFKKNNNLEVCPKLIIQQNCKQHVKLLKNIIYLFYKNFKAFGIDLKLKLYSISSLAAYYYYKNYNFIEKKINLEVELYVREAYFGGRSEVFGNPLEGESIAHFDFPTMYAGCMKEEFPIGKYSWEFPKEVKKIGFYTIKYESNLELPILPTRLDKLYFLNGISYGTFWFEEILLFQKMGGIVLNIEKALIFNSTAPVFKDFIEDLESLKKQNPTLKFITKLFINSFYGRLGMTNKRKRAVITDTLDKGEEYIKFDDNYYIESKTVIGNFKRNIIMAAIITSKARIKLYKAYIDVIKVGARLLYSDTDSIIIAFPKKLSLLNKQIGEVFFDTQKKDTLIKDAIFSSSKSYALVFFNNEEVVKIKGIKTTSINFFKFKYHFINNIPLLFESQFTVQKKFYILTLKHIVKKINLNLYSKRLFYNNYTYTRPILKIDTHIKDG
jgi:hypothetical protein